MPVSTLAKPYLLNVDLLDFFHAVKRDRIYDIFRSKPFNFKRNLPDILADLTTYQARLPMGTPTSPVLSNFACRELDRGLLLFSENMLWTYTRYADDMSFSSPNRSSMPISWIPSERSLKKPDLKSTSVKPVSMVRTITRSLRACYLVIK